MKTLVTLFLGALLSSSHALEFYGVNLAGADFGTDQNGSGLPGNFGTQYTYPNQDEVDYFQGKNFNLIRLPFRWERLQRSLNGSFDTAEQNRLVSFANASTAKGMSVILDPHNYARYNGNLIGSGSVSNANFADFWSRLAELFKDNPRVIFGLMNEPSRMPTAQWRIAANAAITSIRNTGATNLILIPGNGWTGGHSWKQDWYDDAGTPGNDSNGYPNGSNAQEMLNIVDPANNFAFDIHQYLDSDFSGTSDTCVSTTVGSTALAEITQWLEDHDRKAILGEFGGGRNATCLAALTDIAQFMEDNPDQWLGWAYWAAGPWWGEYIFTLEPQNINSANPTDRPQMAALTSVMQIPIPIPVTVANFSTSEFTFLSETGLSYRVQRSQTLTAPSWLDYGNEASGTGAQLTLPFPSDSSSAQEFYRLKIER